MLQSATSASSSLASAGQACQGRGNKLAPGRGDGATRERWRLGRAAGRAKRLGKSSPFSRENGVVVEPLAMVAFFCQ
jgi:hypothetical protein